MTVPSCLPRRKKMPLPASGTMRMTRSMIPYNSGDVVLVRFPFTDLQSSKRRPALIVNPPSFGKKYGDIVVLALSSQDPQDDTLKLVNWKAAGLPKPTWVKAL